MKSKIPLLSVFFALLMSLAGNGHDSHESEMKFKLDGKKIQSHDSSISGEAAVDVREIGVEEKLGKKISANAVFLDENGKQVLLGNYIDRPTLILPVYFYCPDTCGLMLGQLSSALNDVPLSPLKDYRVLSLSIDFEDDVATAHQTKNNYFRLIKKDFPEENWKYLTSDLKNINLFADSIGFRYKRTGKHIFAHPNVMMVVSRDGTIIRYLYGPTFLPFDIGMALTEAEKGTPSLSVRKLLSYCFSYEPEKKAYTFRAVQFLVIGVLLIMGIALFVLLRKKPGKL